MRKSLAAPLLLAISLSACSQSLTAQPPEAIPAPALPATSLDLRIEQLVPLINGNVALESYFSPTFLAAVPPAQFKAVSDGLIAQYGSPQKVISITKSRPSGASVKLQFEKAIATIEIDVEPTPAAKVIGLLISGFAVSGDTIDAVGAEFKALPGKSGFILSELPNTGSAQTIASHNAGQQFAIGSTFKLYILAELAAQIRAGERKWSDVVPLSHHSFSSAATQGWPKDSPVTLYTLAGWMISVSDNGATDTLLNLLGREAVERRLAMIGHSAPDKTLPFLSTVEAFALKADAPLRKNFLNANEAEQRVFLQKEKASLTLEKIDGAAIGGAPAAIDTVEWFASPTDLLTLMQYIAAQSDDRMLSLMAINPGMGAAPRKDWQYIGYKGGSEPGVMSMSYLLRGKNGKWYVATGSWNDTEKEVDQGKFANLMERLTALVAK